MSPADERVAETAALGLLPLEAPTAAQFSSAVATHGKDPWYYYTPFLIGLARAEGRQVLCGRIEGAFVLLLLRAARGREVCDLILPPLPLSRASFRAAMDCARKLMPGAPGRILWCDEADMRELADWGVGPAAQQPPDLIYDPNAVSSLAGGALRDVRKRVHRVLREHSIALRRPGAQDLPACLGLLQAWFEARDAVIRPIGDMGYTRGALSLLGEARPPEWDAMLYEVDGRVAALSVGGAIRPGRMCFFALKADPAIPGLSTFARWETLYRWAGLGTVNDGSALGRGGLLQHKRKFRPVAELPVWQISLAGTSRAR